MQQKKSSSRSSYQGRTVEFTEQEIKVGDTVRSLYDGFDITKGLTYVVKSVGKGHVTVIDDMGDENDVGIETLGLVVPSEPLKFHIEGSGTESPLKVQYGGSHYKDRAIQPIEYILANDLNFCEGCVVKYVTRWRDKGGIEDLKKAKHYIDFLIENEEKQE